MLFVILQKYDFSSKSQRWQLRYSEYKSCLWYCKSTIFQANHNYYRFDEKGEPVVCDTAKVRFFKKITTARQRNALERALFVILQKYDFSSKSQHKSGWIALHPVVCDTAKVRFFKQITTTRYAHALFTKLFVILQKYDFSSKSQPYFPLRVSELGCLWYCKSTIFQANHNIIRKTKRYTQVVCDTAKVRFFKQITTTPLQAKIWCMLFVILQKYDFSSKSQRPKSEYPYIAVVCDTAKVRFFKQITTGLYCDEGCKRCLWYCKSTIFQANHNLQSYTYYIYGVVCDTAKVRFFKQITTNSGM